MRIGINYKLEIMLRILDFLLWLFVPEIRFFIRVYYYLRDYFLVYLVPRNYFRVTNFIIINNNDFMSDSFILCCKYKIYKNKKREKANSIYNERFSK